MDKVDISFKEIIEGLKKVKFGRYDLVVGIADGGLVPAALIAKKLHLDMQVMKVSFRDAKNNPKFERPHISYCPKIKGKKILLVDDVSKTGATLEAARKALAGNEVETFVLNGKADMSLFIIESCINWPWGSL